MKELCNSLPVVGHIYWLLQRVCGRLSEVLQGRLPGHCWHRNLPHRRPHCRDHRSQPGHRRHPSRCRRGQNFFLPSFYNTSSVLSEKMRLPYLATAAAAANAMLPIFTCVLQYFLASKLQCGCCYVGFLAHVQMLVHASACGWGGVGGAVRVSTERLLSCRQSDRGPVLWLASCILGRQVAVVQAAVACAHSLNENVGTLCLFL